MYKDKTLSKSTFLLPNNGVLVGAGSLLNMQPGYFKYKTSPTESLADMNATRSDWLNVGNAIKEAMNEW